MHERLLHRRQREQSGLLHRRHLRQLHLQQQRHVRHLLQRQRYAVRDGLRVRQLGLSREQRRHVHRGRSVWERHLRHGIPRELLQEPLLFRGPDVRHHRVRQLRQLRLCAQQYGLRNGRVH